MKNLIVDANFPRTLDGRVYHLGIKAGEVANRIITVGSPSRAERIATYLDSTPKPFILNTERGFMTITGRFKGVPVSIVSIGMGSPNMDFFIREARESLNGDLVVVRLGSCGSLIDVSVGTVVIPKASIAVTRNYDFDFSNGSTNNAPPYRVSKLVHADSELSLAVGPVRSHLVASFESSRQTSIHSDIVSGTLNASTDSFYSSQGRITSFPDHNADIIDKLKASYVDLATFEMETFHLFHLAASWPAHERPRQVATSPITDRPASLNISEPHLLTHQASQAVPPDVSTSAPDGHVLIPQPKIRAAAAQMVFAARGSRDFITPEQVQTLEDWCAVAVLQTVTSFKIDPARLHAETGSVWEL